jgi:hypothetical protein
MTFRRWLQLFDEFCKDSELSEWLFDKLLARAETFDDWRNIFYRAEFGSIIEGTALLQAATHAKNFGQWLWICEELSDRPCLNQNLQTTLSISIDEVIRLADNSTDADWTKNQDSLDAISLSRWNRIFDRYEFYLFARERIMEIKERMRGRKLQKREEMKVVFSPLKI